MKRSPKRRTELDRILTEIVEENRQEALNRRQVWEHLWRRDPEGGCTKSTGHYVRLSSTKRWPVLDVASGSGRFLKLRDKDSWYVGIDVAWEAVKIGAGRNKGSDYVQADAAYLPFREGAFEKAFSFHGIDFIGQYAPKAVGELARVVRKGGDILFTVHHTDLLIGKGREFVELGHGKLFGVHNPLYLDGVFAIDRDGLDVLLEEAGVKDSGTMMWAKKSGQGVPVLSSVLVKAVKR
ncbi:MAG: class I SAM-dependent methyltransferase [Candidatus Micrarchaeota archaeon]|nr:class I SAM-dependent methyltransferase [Candidatus Micrarchaeota archaeon]